MNKGNCSFIIALSLLFFCSLGFNNDLELVTACWSGWRINLQLHNFPNLRTTTLTNFLGISFCLSLHNLYKRVFCTVSNDLSIVEMLSFVMLMQFH